MHPIAQQRADVIKKRAEWVEKQQCQFDINKLVFLDESSINLGMTRLYGRALKGERVDDYIPDVRFQRTSILSTVRLDGSQNPYIFTGTLNGERFKKYVDDTLSPALFEGDILILDNSSVHKVHNVLDSVIIKGVTVVFLPPYSPDFNPIELLWSKMKTFLRKAKARTKDNLEEALNQALDSITVQDIKNWFCHDGYRQQ